MTADQDLPLARHLAQLPDPRIDRTRKHSLCDILIIALCATIAGADSWEEVRRFGEANLDWLKGFLSLPHGIPSHDTFNRVFARLDPEAFGRCVAGWIDGVCQATGLRHIAIDGESARSAPRPTSTGGLHRINARAVEDRLILGQEAVADGSHEIAAVPDLLRVLDLKGALVTLDAAGCQEAIAARIRAQGGGYLLSVKGNQPTLYEAAQAVIGRACEGDLAGVEHDGHEQVEDGHGRHEERYTRVIYHPEGLPQGWPDVAAVVLICRERAVGGVNASTAHYYLTSLRATAAELGRLVRRHWSVENELHWVLDPRNFGRRSPRTFPTTRPTPRGAGPVSRPGRHPVRASRGIALAVADGGDGLRLGQHLLAAVRRVDVRGRLGQGPRRAARRPGRARAAEPRACGPGLGLHAGRKRGAHTGPNPTDRAKRGLKRHLATDAGGLPLAVLIGPANRRDEQPVGPLLSLLRATLLAAGLPRPGAVQADRGYGFPWTIALVRAWGMLPVIAPRGSPHGSELGRTRYVVERMHAWFSRFRRLVQYYERRPEHAQGFHTLAACVICARRLGSAKPRRGRPAVALAAWPVLKPLLTRPQTQEDPLALSTMGSPARDLSPFGRGLHELIPEGRLAPSWHRRPGLGKAARPARRADHLAGIAMTLFATDSLPKVWQRPPRPR